LYSLFGWLSYRRKNVIGTLAKSARRDTILQRNVPIKIWLFGTSASGKKALPDYIQQDRNNRRVTPHQGCCALLFRYTLTELPYEAQCLF
jgi:hypothetical protein